MASLRKLDPIAYASSKTKLRRCECVICRDPNAPLCLHDYVNLEDPSMPACPKQDLWFEPKVLMEELFLLHEVVTFLYLLATIFSRLC